MLSKTQQELLGKLKADYELLCRTEGGEPFDSDWDLVDWVIQTELDDDKTQNIYPEQHNVPVVRTMLREVAQQALYLIELIELREALTKPS